MATDATGTPTSPDGIARIVPSDAPAVSSLTSGVNAIADTVQTALSNNYLRKTSGNIVNADINAVAAIAYSKLNLLGSITNTDLAGSITGAKLVNGTVTGTQIATDVALAGNPTTTTQAADNSSTRLATTGFVIGQVGTTTPNNVTTTAGAVGTSLKYARADHRHVLDTNLFDGTGTSSYLNPLRVGSHLETAGLLAIGDSVEYRGSTVQGWDNAAVSDIWVTHPWAPSYWSQFGTLQVRIQYAFVVTVAATGTSQTFIGRYYTCSDGGTVSASTSIPGLGGTAISGGTGVKTFDSGWNTASGTLSTVDGLLMLGIRTTMVGGSIGSTSRSNYTIQIRVV